MLLFHAQHLLSYLSIISSLLIKMLEGLADGGEAGAFERRVWDPATQRFAATGEAMDGDVATLEQLSDKLSGGGGRYLKGPVPWPWIVVAAALPGKALIVGLCLWRLAGATHNRTVVLGNRDLAPFGIDRAAKSRALAVLESAGLVSVVREANRFPVVTLLASLTASRRGAERNSAAFRKSTR